MWLNYKQYEHANLIDEIMLALQDDLKNYIASNQLIHFEAKEKERAKLGMRKHQAKDWYIVPIIRAREITEWAASLPKTTALAVDLPGIVNITLNCFAPQAGAPWHSDYDYDMRNDLTEDAKCFAILLGVKIPSADIELGGFQLGEEKQILTTNCKLAFDGGIPHMSWNNTDSWRYSANIDIEQRYWDVSAVNANTSLDSNS